MNRTFRLLSTLLIPAAILTGADAAAQMKVSYGDAGQSTRAVAALPMDQVEKLPEFKGDLPSFLMANFHYPDTALAVGAEPSFTVEFVVATTGLLQELRLSRSTGFQPLDAEALRIFSPMQQTAQWTPGYRNGRAVPVRYSLPITLDPQYK